MAGANAIVSGLLRNLSASTDRVSRASERLSSGLRLNRPSDDAASLAIATRLNSDARVFTQAVRNVNDGISYLAIADGALGTLTDILTRQIELASQAANGSYSTAQRTALNTEGRQLTLEYNRLLSTTRFNGLEIFGRLNINTSIQSGAGAENATGIGFLASTPASSTVGSGSYSSADAISSGFQIADGVAIGDLNNDGRSEIAVLTYDNAGDPDAYVEIYSIDSNGNLTQLSQTQVFTSDSGGIFYGNVSIEIGQFTGDGSIDVRIGLDVDPDGTQGALRRGATLTGLGNGSFSTVDTDPGSYSFASAAPSTAFFNINNDGFTDYVETSGGQLTSYLQGTTQLASATSESLTQADFDLRSASLARSALTSLQSEPEKITQRRGVVGSLQSRLATNVQVLQSTTLAYRAAESRIADIDVASETAQLTRNQILQQTTAAVLALASQSRSLVLDLLR